MILQFYAKLLLLNFSKFDFSDLDLLILLIHIPILD